MNGIVKGLVSVGLVSLLVLPASAQVVPDVVEAIRASVDQVGKSDVSGPGSIIRKLLDAVAGKKNLKPDTTLSVVLGNFTYSQSGLGSPFSRFLEDQFSAALVKSKYFNLYPRDVLKNLPVGFEETHKDLLGADNATGSLSGKFAKKSDGSVQVDFQLADLVRGQVIGVGSIVVKKSQLPAGVDLEPPAAPSLPAPPAPAAASGALTVSVTTDRGTAGTYYDGEEMTLSVVASKDCWLKVYLVDAKGEIKLVYPNEYSGASLVKGGTLIALPGANAGFAFVLGPPHGVETLRVVASTVPFQTEETAFESLGTNAGQVLTRGLTLQKKATTAEVAQAQVRYTVEAAPRM